MSWSDPIADMLTRIRNGQSAGQDVIEMPSSNLKTAIVKVLKEEGYIADYEVEGEVKKTLRIELKYNAEHKPVIRGIQRKSSPGLREYCGWKEIPRVLGGLGTAVVSTSAGVMSGGEARRRHLGGEVLCTIW